MIPLYSTIPTQRFPWVNYSLIGANVALFAYETTLGTHLESFLLAHGWVPAGFSQALAHGQVPGLAPLLISMFLHGNWLHLFGNLLYLHIFGGNVEDRLGSLRYLCFYCVGGVVAVLVQTYVSPFSRTPMIGASGAIAAVAGAYFVFYPTARVLTLVPLIFSFRVVRVPAVCICCCGRCCNCSPVCPPSPPRDRVWSESRGGPTSGALLRAWCWDRFSCLKNAGPVRCGSTLLYSGTIPSPRCVSSIASSGEVS